MHASRVPVWVSTKILHNLAFMTLYTISVNYVSINLNSKDRWTLTTTGKYCPDTKGEGYENSLSDCKTYCMQTGARKLAYHTTSYCRCCTENSILNYYPNAEIYELTGTNVYSNTHTHYTCMYIGIY